MKSSVNQCLIGSWFLLSSSSVTFPNFVPNQNVNESVLSVLLDPSTTTLEFPFLTWVFLFLFVCLFSVDPLLRVLWKKLLLIILLLNIISVQNIYRGMIHRYYTTVQYSGITEKKIVQRHSMTFNAYLSTGVTFCFPRPSFVFLNSYSFNLYQHLLDPQCCCDECAFLAFILIVCSMLPLFRHRWNTNVLKLSQVLVKYKCVGWDIPLSV